MRFRAQVAKTTAKLQDFRGAQGAPVYVLGFSGARRN